MQTEKPISLEFQEYLPSGNCPYNSEGPLALPSSSNDHGGTEKPAKRPTRRWAAWTREEEESFFTALRQVGKNFEKITSRVQSKNKDQVRHYYYRLVRRMNKLLGPGFCLDAKNSKDTNAAMLRWWSLLEKYSCKASKLHLKPRRFKIFIEALEHQLLKDRKKNVRRRSSQGENIPTLSPPPFPQQSKPSANENRSVHFVLVDSQNIQKAGNGKAPTVRRAPSIGVSKSSNRGDSSPPKASRQRRKTAAIKKWEKAAIAGVSLVADAAEHLERSACVKETETYSVLTRSSMKAVASSIEESCARPSGVIMPPPSIPNNIPSENGAQNTEKLKLQLFPIDDGTKRALEMDKHNPYLELTLSTRKKITSIMEHLAKKWGNSSVACGELMLFPYFAQREDVLKYQRWTRSSYVSAGDVYSVIGSPPFFRLRYGWISEAELQSASLATPSDISRKRDMLEHSQKDFLVNQTTPSGPWSNSLRKPTSPVDRTQASSSHTDGVLESMDDSPDEATGYAGSGPRRDLVDLSGFGANVLSRRSLACGGTSSREMENMGAGNSSSISTREWADSLTNISVGDLLNEVSDEDADCVETPTTGITSCVEQIPFSCDSFDAAIAHHVRSYQDKTSFQSAVMPHSSSIWDAEDTCDAFSFQKRFLNNEQAQSSSEKTYAVSFTSVQNLPKEDALKDTTAEGDPMEERPCDPNLLGNSSKDLNSLTDMYWPESLGPLDLDAPSCRYVSQDLILSDSLSGLSRLIASSLDAFQNCSFFSNPTSSATQGQGKASAPGAGNDVV